MTCLERILTSKSVQALLDILLGPELTSQKQPSGVKDALNERAMTVVMERSMFSVVTIVGEHGSGRADIGRKLTELLGWECVDKQIIERVAAMGKVDTSCAADADEKSDAWWQRVMRSFRYGASWSYSREAPRTDIDHAALQFRTTSPNIDNLALTAISRCPSLDEIFDRDSAELHWLVEVVLGDTQHIDECLSDAVRLAGSNGYIAPKWIAPWVRQCVVRAALDRVRTEIQFVAAGYTAQAGAKMPSLRYTDEQSTLLRRVPVERIRENRNALERAALILHFHLGFSVQDCALLMDCRRSLIEPACASALWRIFEEENTAVADQKDMGEPGSLKEPIC